jgi:nucleoside-diphosphate-sugar epimerase
MAARRRVLIAGGTGTVGRATAEHMAASGDWEVIAVSRREPSFSTGAKFVSVDLTDAKQCAERIGALGAFTHVVFAALYEKPSIVKGWAEDDQIKTNLALLVNLVEAVEKTSPALEHITLMQGAKAYGVHLGNSRMMPAKESHGRFMPPNFYYNQEDWLRERQKQARWSWTAIRPPAVCTEAVGTPLNLTMTIGVFAAISRELGIPLRFPGGEAAVYEVCDAKLVAKSVAWAATSEKARNHIFNVANGDHFQWPYIWPLFAELFKMPHAQPHTISLGQVMLDKEPVWQRIVQKHGLKPHGYKELVPSWDFPDFAFRLGRPSNPTMMSTIKIRQAGFHDCIDTEEMFTQQLRALQERKVLPY